MEFDPTPYRRQTAAAMAGRIHLNNAGSSLMPDPVLDAIHHHLEMEHEIGGYEAADAAAADIAEAYQNVGALIGAAAANIAVVENATVGFALALSAFDFASGDTILTTRNDYISNQLMYLSLASRQGVHVVRAADLPEGGVDPDSIRALVREHRPRVVALTWVPTNSGLVQNARAVGQVCAEEGVPYLLDACQAVGQIPIDVESLECDFLSATARKFLRGPRGVGFLYVSDRVIAREQHPLFIDMRGAEWAAENAYVLAPDARRFENWEFAYALLLGMGEAARYARSVGVERAGKYAAELAAYIRARLGQMPGVRVLDRGADRCAIVTAEFESTPAHEIMKRLREQAINTGATLQKWAVIDMADKGARTALRISPHYFNTRKEIDITLSALEEFALDRGPRSHRK
jgi:selenocysteine lyase/cysteine desulfurase